VTELATAFQIDGVSVRIDACHGPDWFPLYITSGTRYSSTLYLRRDDLRALRDRLDEIDKAFPEPEDAA